MKKYIHIYNEIFFSFLYRDEDFPAVKKSKGYTFKSAIKIICYSIKLDLTDFLFGNNDILKNKIWLYAESVNQLRAIEFLSELENTIIVTNSKNIIKLYPEKEIYRIAHKYKIFKRINWLRRRHYYKLLFKNKFKDHFNTIFIYDGIYESLKNIVRVAGPKAIVLANDHNVTCRALLFAGKANRVTTIYLQHATVTDKFPPLKFDLSLLDGEDALNKYAKAGELKGRIELVGMPKFDQYFDRVNRSNVVRTIGVALNENDDFSAYFEVCDLIRKNFGDINFIYRFHNSINTDNIFIPGPFILSKPNEETSFDFLEKVDVLFAGNSSIHLEATLMNVLSVYIDFNDINEYDYYGFLSNKLVDKVPSCEILSWLHFIKEQKPNVRSRAKFYVDTVDSDWDGKSREKILSYISEYL